MMNAKDLIIDFINYAFLLILTAFCVMYFAVGDRFYLFGVFLRIFLPISIFGIFFLVNLKIKRNLIFKFNREKVLEEIIAYFTEQDRLKDKIVLIILPIVILSVGFMDGNIVFLDIIQALAAFLYMFLWHKILFKAPDDTSGIICLRNIDKIKDEIAIYVLPLLVAGVGIFKIDEDILVDFFQGMACYVIMIVWHYLLFKD